MKEGSARYEARRWSWIIRRGGGLVENGRNRPNGLEGFETGGAECLLVVGVGDVRLIDDMVLQAVCGRTHRDSPRATGPWKLSLSRHERTPLGDEATVEVAEKHLTIELGAEPEVEVVEGLLEGEAGVLQPPAELILLAGEQLFLQEAQEVGIRHLRLGGPIETTPDGSRGCGRA